MSETTATVPLSGRVAENDFKFLMEYPISGKVTASEKLRYVVSFFRAYHRSLASYEESLTELNRILEPAKKTIKRAEAQGDARSELVDRAMQLLPEILAHLVTARVPAARDQQSAGLIDFEERIFAGINALLESVLRMSITARSPTYNPNLFRKCADAIAELVDLLQSRNPNSNKNSK